MPQSQKVMYDLPERYGAQYTPSTGADWDLRETSRVRWTDLDETISEGIAGRRSPSETATRITRTVE